MKTQLLLIVFSLVLCFPKLQAQQVISSGGDEYKTENVSLSWTIGEPVIETLSNNDVILTQGFQQGYLSTNSIRDLFARDISLDIYPNPTPDKLNLLVENKSLKSLKYYLHSMEGKILSNGSIESDLTKIDMHRYPHGVYLLRIVKGSGEAVQSFRVVKQ